MKQALALVFLFLAVPVWGQPGRPGPAGFPSSLAASVLTAAFEFLEPRTLEPVPVRQLALWGLRGVTSIDAGLTIEDHGVTFDLRQADRSIHQCAIPTEPTVAAWGEAGAELMSAAWDVSEVVRGAGSQALITSFFDELFNHLDPYSRYVSPAAADLDRARRSGAAGIGLVLAQVGKAFVVQSVNADGPGAEAGIIKGDSILAVDNQPTLGADLATVLSWIAGIDGTEVGITLRRRDGSTQVIDLERVVVPPETVFAEQVGNMLLVRVAGFSSDTDRRLGQEFGRFFAKGATSRRLRGVVLDLRGNRGGLLRQAVAATSLMLEAGLVAVTAGRNPGATHEWRAVAHDATEGAPIVVLVDGRSASAAEIMAAALANQGRAVVVGSSTLGKGLVQTIATLPDGGELFVTWSRVLAPLGWPIQGLGVLPQVCTSQGLDATMQQLASLSRGRPPLADALARHDAVRAPLPGSEIVALRAACPAAEGREADLMAARYLLEHPAAYAAARRSRPQLGALKP